MSEPVPQADPQPTPEPQPAPVEQPLVEQPAAPTTPATVVVRYDGVPTGVGYWEPTGAERGVNWYPGRELEVPADRAAMLLDQPGFVIGKPVEVPRQP